MSHALSWFIAKSLAAIVGACVGYFVGFALSYFLGDHGDVGSAFIALLTIPLAMITCALLSWFALRRIERLR